MLQWPPHIRYALDSLLLYGNAPRDEEYVDELVYYWGALDEQALLRALDEGDDFDRLFALRALGYLGGGTVVEPLRRFLRSERPLERWASASELGKMCDEQAEAPLLALLTEFLTPSEEYERSPYYRGWRMSVPSILASWGKSTFIPPLRNALQEAIRVEQALPPPPSPSQYPKQEDWRFYQDVIVYSLGRLGAFGVLTGIESTDERIDLWRVHLLMGSLHGRHAIHRFITWDNVPEVHDDLSQGLERHFGLEIEQRNRSLEHYEREKAFEISEMYRHLARQRTLL